jgi:hypothetical protein
MRNSTGAASESIGSNRRRVGSDLVIRMLGRPSHYSFPGLTANTMSHWMIGVPNKPLEIPREVF